MEQFDFIILGGGAAAFAAAIRADELDAGTAMVNDGLPLGGTCVNVGCVPSKTLIHAAEVFHGAQNHDIPGIRLEAKVLEFGEVVAHELALVEEMRKEKYERVLRELHNVKHVAGRARFVGTHEVEVGGRRLGAEKILIATGSTAVVPAIDGIREAGFLTHIEALRLRERLASLAVVGGGPVGLEFAQLFARFGTKVTLLQRRETLFPPAERELTTRLREVLEGEGIAVETGVEVRRATRSAGKKILTCSRGGQEHTVQVDEILVASGKAPNTADLDLPKAGVTTDRRGAIVVNATLQTKQPHVFAAGDVAALPLRQEPTAGAEGTLAAENALQGSSETLDYTTIPYTIFTDPQLAGVGLTEAQQMERLGTCACRTLSFKEVPKARILGRTEGLIKMAIHPKTGQIMGVHILAPHAGELVATATALVRNRNTIDDVTHMLPMFPTLSEAIKLVALSFTRDISKLSCCV